MAGISAGVEYQGRGYENFKGNPIDNLKPLAKAKIPIIAVAGDSDKTVPYDENLEILAARYKNFGERLR